MTRPLGYTRELFTNAGTAEDADQLSAAGAARVFADDHAADVRSRPGLRECLRVLEPGDTLLVTGSARLSHSVPHFVSTVQDLTSRGVFFRSLTEPALCTGTVQTIDPGEVIGALEGLRRRLAGISTREGMAHAAAAGRRPGRPTVMTPDRVAMAVELRDVGRPISHIARVLGVSPTAVQRALASSPRPHEPRV